MYVFSYDPTTRRFTGGIRADFDQLEPGKLQCPAFATRIAPPKFDAAKEVPFHVPDPKDFEGGRWELRPIEANGEEGGE